MATPFHSCLIPLTPIMLVRAVFLPLSLVAVLLSLSLGRPFSCILSSPCTESLPALSRQASALLSSLSQPSVDAISTLSSSTIDAIIDQARLANPSAGTPSSGAATSTSATTQAKSGDSYGGAGKTYEPASGTARSSLVLLHGLSANVDQVAPVVGIAQRAGLQSTRFILPQAPDAFVNYRRRTEPSWFNVDGTNPSAAEHPDEILASVARVEKILQGELDKGVEKVAVLGMSQGGAVASTLFMRGKVKVEAAVLLATWLPLASSYPRAATPASSGTPALMVHGGNDRVVELQWAEDSAEIMRQSGRTVEFEVEANAPHVFGIKLFSVAQRSINYLKERGIN